MAVYVDADLRVLSISCVHTSLGNCILQKLERVVDRVEGIIVRARSVGFKAYFSQLVSGDRLLDVGCDFVVDLRCINGIVRALNVDDQVKS